MVKKRTIKKELRIDDLGSYEAERIDHKLDEAFLIIDHMLGDFAKYDINDLSVKRLVKRLQRIHGELECAHDTAQKVFLGPDDEA
jgi:hypothetical protein